MKNLKYALFFAMMIALSACATAPTSAPAPQAKPVYSCTVKVTSGMGWSNVLGKFGYVYQKDAFPGVLVNGVETSDSYNLQPGDFVALVNKPDKCSDEYIGARQVHFESAKNYRELSSFQTPITGDELETALSGVCKDVRFGLGLGFDNNIYTGGCGYPTFVMTSDAGGNPSCTKFDSAAQAYESIKPKLSTFWWIAVASTSEGRDLCK